MSGLWRIGPAVLLAAGLLLIGGRSRADTSIETMRRLYDFTPVSPSNPVLARVPDCAIEIPLSEFRAYAAGEMRDGRSLATLPPAERRRLLEDLIDEHLWLWDGYQKKAEQTAGMVAMLKQTQAMLLEETFTQQEIGDKTQTREQYETLLQKLRDQIFDRTDITVSNEAYAKLKDAARSLNSTTRALAVLGKPVSAKAAPEVAARAVDRLPEDVRDFPLAVCKIATVTIGDFLYTYTQMPLLQRPDLEKQASVVAVLKQMLQSPLLVAEARARGLEQAPIVREKMQLNRNTLTRLYALDQMTAKVVTRLQSPEGEAGIKQWYEDHVKTRYTAKSKDGQVRVLSLEKDRDRIADDYFLDLQDRMRADQLKAWRAGRKIEIAEAALAQAAL